MTGFRVDTKLFRELGELLVAKESTALVELIKNAYDADATLVTVSGHHLDRPEEGRIVVSDDGIGMTSDEFEKGFLTIAGRTKNIGKRRSKLYGRRYTGEKGVGRLAAHKLGTALSIQSCQLATPKPTPRRRRDEPQLSVLSARIDWDTIEALETLDQIHDSGAVQLNTHIVTPTDHPNRTPGTILTIAPLRSRWSTRMRNSFLREAITIVPHPVSHQPLPEGLTKHPLLFDDIPLRDSTSTDPPFEIVFGGDLSTQESLLPTIASAASWVAEIDYDRSTGILRLAVAPTLRMLKDNPNAEGFHFERRLGKRKGPNFKSRILQRSGTRWDRHARGIRIFMEGFRVEPYGGPTDDWLSLESDYSSRAARHQPNLSRLGDFDLPEGLRNEELQMQSNAAYLGAVFLYRSSSPDLQMLVNREGFLSSTAFDFMSHWTRVSIDLIVRLGARYRTEGKKQRSPDLPRQRDFAARADVNETPSTLRVRESASKMKAGFADLEEAVRKHDYSAAVRTARNIQPSLQEVYDLADQFGSEAVQWRVLASLGTELAAFVHEINALGTQATNLARDLEAAADLGTVKQARAAIRRARRRTIELADRIRRNASYLVDSTSFEGRRRRSRLPLRDRLEKVSEFFQARIEKKGIRLDNRIEEETRTPPMFPSELSGILMNLLSNAVKFTDADGRIVVRSRATSRKLTVTMENTGTEVDLDNATALFNAFQSTTEQPDATLGQGMGMGLTITRAFVREYGGDIAFVKPRAGFATAIQFSIPAR